MTEGQISASNYKPLYLHKAQRLAINKPLFTILQVKPAEWRRRLSTTLQVPNQQVQSVCLHAHFNLVMHSKWPPLLSWRRVSWQRHPSHNQIFLCWPINNSAPPPPRTLPPPDLPHSHLNNERRAGVMSNLGVRYRRGHAFDSSARVQARIGMRRITTGLKELSWRKHGWD